MAPSLLLATVAFAVFLVVLALIAFAAYRFSARGAGPGLGAAGGCALAAVLLGAAFFALIGFAIVIGVLVVHRAEESGKFDRIIDRIQEKIDRDVDRTSDWEFKHHPLEAPDADDTDDTDSAETDDEIRQY